MVGSMWALTDIPTANVTFQSIYTPYSNAANATQYVVAGLFPVGSNGIDHVPRAYLSLFASAYTMGFMTDPRYVVSVAPVLCSGRGCLSIFLPGGMEVVRVDDGTGSNTLFSGDYSGDYSAITVNDAPGYQMEYGLIESVESDFQFDRESDCKMYLQSVNDGLFICTVEKGVLLYLGRHAPPHSHPHSTPLDQRLTFGGNRLEHLPKPALFSK